MEYLESVGREETLTPSSSKSSPTTEGAGLLDREIVLTALDGPVLNFRAVDRDKVIVCRAVADKGDESAASSALC